MALRRSVDYGFPRQNAGCLRPLLYWADSAAPVGKFAGKILGFSGVGRQVVKFPRFVGFGDQFPILLADGAIAFVFPEKGAVEIVVLPSIAGTRLDACRG